MSFSMNLILPSGWKAVTSAKVEETNDTRTVGRKKHFVQEIATGDLYLDDPDLVLRIKSLEIILSMSFYLVAKVVRDFFVMFASVSEDAEKGEIGEIVKDIGQFVWTKVRDPFFAAAVLALAFFALIFPFEGRKYIALVEREWHYVEQLRNPQRRIHYHDIRHEQKGCFTSRKYYFLLAYCFQPHGNISDTRYVILKIKDDQTV